MTPTTLHGFEGLHHHVARRNTREGLSGVFWVPSFLFTGVDPCLSRIAALKRQAANERARFEEASSRMEDVISQLQEANEKLAEGSAESRSKVWSQMSFIADAPHPP